MRRTGLWREYDEQDYRGNKKDRTVEGKRRTGTVEGMRRPGLWRE